MTVRYKSKEEKYRRLVREPLISGVYPTQKFASFLEKKRGQSRRKKKGIPYFRESGWCNGYGAEITGSAISNLCSRKSSLIPVREKKHELIEARKLLVSQPRRGRRRKGKRTRQWPPGLQAKYVETKSFHPLMPISLANGLPCRFNLTRRIR